jgi:hypothetical protein
MNIELQIEVMAIHYTNLNTLHFNQSNQKIIYMGAFNETVNVKNNISLMVLIAFQSLL